MHPIEVLKRCSGVIPDEVDIFDTTASVSDSTPTVTATYELDNAGVGHSDGQPDWDWLLYGLSSDYSVRATLISGTSPSGSALSSNLNLSTTRNWYLSNSVRHSTLTCQLQIKIFRVADGSNIATATVTITADNS